MTLLHDLNKTLGAYGSLRKTGADTAMKGDKTTIGKFSINYPHLMKLEKFFFAFDPKIYPTSFS